MRFRLIFLMFAAVCVLLVAPAGSTFAQCAMCKAAIEASTNVEALSRGLNLAALVLLIPPVSIFAGLFGVFYHYRNFQGRGR